VLIKAAAGGGGKGMRLVERGEDFAAALASCQREALSSFGDDKVLIEKYLSRSRHIEFQIFADTQRQLRASFRTRLLGAAPSPESARRSAGSGNDERTAHGDGQGGRRRRARGRLRRRRHRGVHRQRHFRGRTEASISWK
jgi:hypothetical protein